MSIKIKIEVLINGTIEKVWNAYTEPEQIVNWNFATDEWCCLSAKNELKVGGQLNYRMEAKDGSIGFDFEAIYDQVVLQKRIAYTLTDGRKVVTEFQEVNDGIKIETNFEAEKENPIEMQETGWQAILNNFKYYYEKTDHL